MFKSRLDLSWLLVLTVSVIFVPAPAVFGAEEIDGRVRGYVPPPTELFLVDGHWTPYTPPQPPEGSQVHVVVVGDTLWDLATHYYGDPYLWPVIWDANRYITYSHWIYPGDPLVVPPQPHVISDEGIKAGYPEPPVDDLGSGSITPVEPVRQAEVAEEAAPEEAEPTGPILLPAAEQQELACSPQLMDHFDPGPLVISAREEPEKLLQSTGDIIYLSAGRDFGISPGEEYAVVRNEGLVQHPHTGRNLAHYVQRLGRIRVIAVQARSATAEIISSCDGIKVGDHLAHYREMPIPMVERIPLQQLYTPTPRRLNGLVIVAAELGASIAGAGDIIGIDLGTRAGVTAGDRILFWRGGEANAPRRVLAQGVVLVTHAGGSVVKILESRTEVYLGDQAEVL